MELKRNTDVEIPSDLLEAIETFPLHREVSHCGQTFHVSPFEIYADCPRCGVRIKVRSFAGGVEIEDVFDAVFAWMTQHGAEKIARRRQQVIQQDQD